MAPRSILNEQPPSRKITGSNQVNHFSPTSELDGGNFLRPRSNRVINRVAKLPPTKLPYGNILLDTGTFISSFAPDYNKLKTRFQHLEHVDKLCSLIQDRFLRNLFPTGNKNKYENEKCMRFAMLIVKPHYYAKLAIPRDRCSIGNADEKYQSIQKDAKPGHEFTRVQRL